MKKIIVVLVLVCLYISAFALASTTNSALFTLDTTDPTLHLQTPNGGEQWYLGDTHNILWTATDTNLIHDSVYLWYSHNGGTSYIPLEEGIANSGSYPWLMPNQTTNNGRIRIGVTDSFGNISQKVSASAFCISFVPPATPEGVEVNLSNAVDAVITWLPVTETIYGTPIVPDGYLVLYNESPYEQNDHFYYFLWDVTSGTSFTHPRVALHRNQMFYRIVAYKDFEERMAHVLREVKANPDRKLTFQEIKDHMNGGVK